MNASTSHLELLDLGETDESRTADPPPARRRRRSLLTYDQQEALEVMLLGLALILAAALIL